jgi:uncharacterized membrane protein YheB (UPF0754 family)
MLYWYLTFPFVSALIGWFTNYLAVKMLFHPRLEKRILFMRIQGVFPKRQRVLGERLGRVVAKELLDMEVIREKIDNDEVRGKLKTAIITEIEQYLEEFRQSNKLVAMFAGEGMMQNIKDKIAVKLDDMIPKLTNQFAGKLEEIDVEGIVAERVNQFSHERLELLLKAVMDKELVFITRLGGVLGFLIGLLQAGASYLIDM